MSEQPIGPKGSAANRPPKADTDTVVTGARYVVLDFFTYENLPEPLQRIARQCAELANAMVTEHVAGSRYPSEVAAGLRKLLEAKDCFVRAAL